LDKVDPGNQYAVPWMWGTVGVIYSADKAKAITGPLPTESLDLIFNKAWAAKFEKCGINLLDSWQDILPLMAKLDEIRPFVRRIASSGYYEQLADGESCLAIGYSGDAMISRAAFAGVSQSNGSTRRMSCGPLTGHGSDFGPGSDLRGDAHPIVSPRRGLLG